MTKATKASGNTFDATEAQLSCSESGADFIVGEADATDAWTQMMFSNLKRMAIDESYRRELISFRTPTLVPIGAEPRQLH